MIRLEGEGGHSHVTPAQISACLDERLIGETRAAVQSHLRACHRCASDLRFWERVRGALRLLTELPVPPGLLPRMLSAIHHA